MVADPVAGYVLAFYAAREVRATFYSRQVPRFYVLLSEAGEGCPTPPVNSYIRPSYINVQTRCSTVINACLH